MFRPFFFVLIFSIVGMPAAKADGEKFVPLSDVFANEMSDSTLLYGLERCAALYLSVYKYSKNNPNTPKSMLDSLDGLYSELALKSAVAVSQSRGIELKAATDVVGNAILAIDRLYIEQMDEHYVRTGAAFSDLVKSDLGSCKQLAEAVLSQH